MVFRLIAVSVPILIGSLIIVWLLVKQERLKVSEGGALSLQSPPLYLQEPGFERTGHQYLYDEQLGWRNIPNWNATTFGKALTTNSKHLRDREYPYEKPENGQRLLVLGDSYAWGYGVADSEIFTEVLEKSDTFRTGNIEVINTAVSGWGTDQAYLYFLAEGAKFQPDVVVLAFYLGNDPDNNVRSIQYGLYKPLFVDMDMTLANVPVPRPPTRPEKLITAKPHRMALTVRIMQRLAESCREVGATFVIMKFGVFQAPEDPNVLQANQNFLRLLPSLTDYGVYHLDLDEEFAKRSITAGELTEGIDDGHWNPFGHRLVAEILGSFLSVNALMR